MDKRQRIAGKVTRLRRLQHNDAMLAHYRMMQDRLPLHLRDVEPEDSLGPFAVEVYGPEVVRLVEWGRCGLGLSPWLVHRSHPKAKTAWREGSKPPTWDGTSRSFGYFAWRSSRSTSTLRQRISRLIRRLREHLRPS